MTVLGDLPWLRIRGRRDPAVVPSAVAGVDLREVPADASALSQAADALTAAHVVLILPQIVPLPIARSLSPDPALLASGEPFLWAAENELTGGASPSQGLWVVPTTVLRSDGAAWLAKDDGSLPVPGLIVPQFAATWQCGHTPQTAFLAGFRALSRDRTAAGALSASLGADRPNGVWWGIGACRGLLGGTSGGAWEDEEALGPDPVTLAARWNELARRVRVELGLPVHPLAPAAAAALRMMRGPVVEAAYWDRFTAALDDLGPQASRLKAACAAARETLWGQCEGAA